MDQRAGTSAVLAIIATVVSFLLTFAGRPGYGLLAGLIAVPLGVMGVIMSASPRVGGGLMSVVAIILGLIAIGLGVLVLIGAIIF